MAHHVPSPGIEDDAWLGSITQDMLICAGLPLFGIILCLVAVMAASLREFKHRAHATAFLAGYRRGRAIPKPHVWMRYALQVVD